MKKLFAVLVAFALVLTMGTTFAFAEDETTPVTTGSITITKAIDGADYKIYKMLDFTPSNAAGDKGIYTIEAGWEDFFATAPATDYFEVVIVGTGDEEQVTVELKEDVTEVDQALAKAALNYAVDKTIAATATATADSATVEFDGLDLGYYAIDTTVGTMGALTRASNELTAVEKNEMPDIDKYVQEDSKIGDEKDGWYKVNDADIDQVVNYKSTIKVGLGAVNYIMHDTMEEGLTFDPNSVRVEDKNGVVDASDYTVVVSPADGHTFDIVFKDSYIATLAQDDTITVYYSATLNEDATIGEEDGNDNEVYLSVGEKSEWETQKHKTSTYTWEMDVLKYTMDGGQKVTLAGATFQLLDKDGNAIKFSDVTVEGGVPTYKVDVDGTIDTIETDENGKFIIVGLDEGTYALHEVSAPEGYNKLAEDIEVIITSTYDDAALTAEYEINDAEPVTIEVENKSGGLFPETGGIGTTIFYIVGGLLMLAAFVILVSKKRMSSFA